MFLRCRFAVLTLLLGCSPVSAQHESASPGEAQLHFRYDSATNRSVYVSPPAQVIAGGAIERPAPTVVLVGVCEGRGCAPTEVFLMFTRTAPDLQLMDSYAPLTLVADSRSITWDEPRYENRPAGTAGTMERVEIPLRRDEVAILAAATVIVGRIGLLRDFELAPGGLRIFDLMARAMAGTP